MAECSFSRRKVIKQAKCQYRGKVELQFNGSDKTHQSCDRETEKQLLSQGHQIVKQQTTSTERLLPTYRLEIIGHFNNWITCHFNNATLIMFTYHALLACIYCMLYHLLHLDYATLVVAHPYIYIYIFSFPPFRFVCIR